LVGKKGELCKDRFSGLYYIPRHISNPSFTVCRKNGTFPPTQAGSGGKNGELFDVEKENTIFCDLLLTKPQYIV
jgi:hypothetical protein